MIFELVGAFSGRVICFIAPSVFFCKIVPGPVLSPAKYHAVAVFVAGCIFMLFGTAMALQDLREQLWK